MMGSAVPYTFASFFFMQMSTNFDTAMEFAHLYLT